eukprot:CAMPEP_0184653756 /NCGR_PEP_ID=MMETSP0308-20130426/11477_1 /TAXON_ID=38269 /ORGANISM="Gloeochaete witrockiana, Strain SAG 46.84" /LENGTH=144 /DNA_ID=CAMNT_0027089393 /DNA_START=512 /DNA_END=943 /DNA_ORIENTATION=+
MYGPRMSKMVVVARGEKCSSLSNGRAFSKVRTERSTFFTVQCDLSLEEKSPKTKRCPLMANLLNLRLMAGMDEMNWRAVQFLFTYSMIISSRASGRSSIDTSREEEGMFNRQRLAGDAEGKSDDAEISLAAMAASFDKLVHQVE